MYQRTRHEDESTRPSTFLFLERGHRRVIARAPEYSERVLRVMVIALVSACAPLPTSDAVVAAAWTAAAVGASAVNRATGGCYAECGAGTVCNPANGLCEVLPCRGQCSEEERCDESGLVARCVSKKGDDIVIETEQEVAKPPEDSQKSE